MLQGALLADSFDGPQLNSELWHRPNWMRHNPDISVGTEDGCLRISGISRPAGKDHQYAGVLSSYFRETDAVLVSRMRVGSSFEGGGRIQHHVHLCSGDWPDFFTEIVFGKIQGGLPRWFCAYVDRLWEYSGYSEYLEPSLPATGREATEWHQVMILHDGETHETSNYLVLNGERKPIGPPHKLRMNHTHVELKVDTNVSGIEVDMEVDDVRLYPNPSRYPVTIVVSSRIVNGKLEVPIHNLGVRIVEAASGKPLGNGLTDEGGQARISLNSEMIYPVAARVEVWDNNRKLVESGIPCYGVRGLYPADIWAIKLPARTPRTWKKKPHSGRARLGSKQSGFDSTY
jgi:hypothetical protein